MLLTLLGENLFAKSMVYVLPRLRLVRYEFRVVQQYEAVSL